MKVRISKDSPLYLRYESDKFKTTDILIEKGEILDLEFSDPAFDCGLNKMLYGVRDYHRHYIEYTVGIFRDINTGEIVHPLDIFYP